MSTKESTKKIKKTEEIQKLRIRVFAYEYKILDTSIKQIIDTALRHDAKINGPIPLPTEIKKYTVNRSTFVHKDAREQFEMRVHRRVIDIPAEDRILHPIMKLQIPRSVQIKIEMKE